MYKVYQYNKRLSKLTIRVRSEKVNKFVTFSSVGVGTVYSSGYPVFQTTDAEVQKAIEASKDFKDKVITLAKAEDEEEIKSKGGGDNNLPAEIVEFLDVTSIQEVAAILKAEPYKIPTNTPVKNLEAKAKELGLSFPNVDFSKAG